MQDNATTSLSAAGWVAAGGVAAQLDIMTRLALTTRLTAATLPGFSGDERAGVVEIGTGVAIY